MREIKARTRREGLGDIRAELLAGIEGFAKCYHIGTHRPNYLRS